MTTTIDPVENVIPTEEHYKIEFLVDDLFTESLWENIDEDSLNNQVFREIIADAIIKGKVKLEPTTLLGSLEDFYPVD